MKIFELLPVFLDEITGELEEGKLYISEQYKCAIHLCACGCKGKTVTPLGANDWTLIKNTENNVSLSPSIANWNGENPPHAHYYITNNKIVWL